MPRHAAVSRDRGGGAAPGQRLVVLVAALGLWRLPDFFLRMHAPALASTLAAWIVTLASIVHFSARGRPGLHVWLIIIVLSITAPITTIVLARAALFRRRQAGDPLPHRCGG
jgi:multicomponent K+:H+ antiporter subunit G